MIKRSSEKKTHRPVSIGNESSLGKEPLFAKFIGEDELEENEYPAIDPKNESRKRKVKESHVKGSEKIRFKKE